MEVIQLRTAALLSVVLGMLVCTFVKTYARDVKTQTADVLPSSTKIERLPTNIFPAEISELLSPEMFSQPDPVRYLLEKIIDKPFNKVRNIQDLLEKWMKYYSKKFPSDYLPYANVLLNLLNCRCNLEGVKKVIDNLRSSSELPYPSPPAGLLSPELNELFTSDIFSDNKPPFHLIIKLANVPMNKPDNIKKEFRKKYFERKLPKRYEKYAAELWSFLMNQSNLKWLIHSVFALRNSIPSKIPTTNSQNYVW